MRGKTRRRRRLFFESAAFGILADPCIFGANVIGAVRVLRLLPAHGHVVFVYGESRNRRRRAFASGVIDAHPAAFGAYVIAVARERRIRGVAAKRLAVAAFGAKGYFVRTAHALRLGANHLLIAAYIARIVGHRFGMRAAKNRLISARLPLHHGEIGAIFAPRDGAIAAGGVAAGVVACEVFVSERQIAPHDAAVGDLNLDVAALAVASAYPNEFLRVFVPFAGIISAGVAMRAAPCIIAAIDRALRIMLAAGIAARSPITCISAQIAAVGRIAAAAVRIVAAAGGRRILFGLPGFGLHSVCIFRCRAKDFAVLRQDALPKARFFGGERLIAAHAADRFCLRTAAAIGDVGRGARIGCVRNRIGRAGCIGRLRPGRCRIILRRACRNRRQSETARGKNDA